MLVFVVWNSSRRETAMPRLKRWGISESIIWNTDLYKVILLGAIRISLAALGTLAYRLEHQNLKNVNILVF